MRVSKWWEQQAHEAKNPYVKMYCEIRAVEEWDKEMWILITTPWRFIKRLLAGFMSADIGD